MKRPSHGDPDFFIIGEPGTKGLEEFEACPKDKGAFGHLGRQDPAIEHDLHVTPEEVLHGCTKKMKISQKVMGPDGRTPKREEKVLTIIVKTGWKAGTKITFQREGDQLRGTIPDDIVFIIRDKPHPQFKKEGTDIRYAARDIIKLTMVKWFPGHGLPYPKDPTKRGDLLVAFDIQFSEHLSKSAWQILWDTLPPHV
ncbi:hypothetical protein MRX96_058441 [Rhipicephalus microplus]